MLTATFRGVPPALLDLAAIIWLAIRLAYTAAYLLDLARIRPALWAGGVLAAGAIFLLPA